MGVYLPPLAQQVWRQAGPQLQRRKAGSAHVTCAYTSFAFGFLLRWTVRLCESSVFPCVSGILHLGSVNVVLHDIRKGIRRFFYRNRSEIIWGGGGGVTQPVSYPRKGRSILLAVCHSCRPQTSLDASLSPQPSSPCSRKKRGVQVS